MLIIADKRIPDEAKENLSKFGEVMYFETNGITYEAISGHPDIFFFHINNRIIVAPNLPGKYIRLLKKKNIEIVEGEQAVGGEYPATASYNAALSDKCLIHNFRYTDSTINAQAQDLDLIHVNQGYCRCNLLPLKNDHFITSDKGIKRVLENHELHVLYVDPAEILLPWVKHGFFGGCCGIWNNTVYLIGSLANFSMGDKVSHYLTGLGYRIEELYSGALFDGGSLLFIE